MVEGVLTLNQVGTSTPVQPAYRDGLRWQAGNTFWIFETDRDGRGSVLRSDSGGGHYVLRRVEG